MSSPDQTDDGEPHVEVFLAGEDSIEQSGAGWEGADEEPLPDGEHAFDVGAGDRYERRQTLGQGGMGRVVAVYDRRLKREVARKELRPGLPGSHGARRLAREAWITARLDHPGIVPVLDAGRDAEGALFYTMPIIRGRTLGAAIAECSTLEARLGLLPRVLAVSQAVAHAHQQGIIHRDLKSANVLVGALGETQVVDWGLARVLTEGAGDPASRDPAAGPPPGPALSMTAQGTVLGTPHSMSPEQANGLPAGPRSDVWSIGVILYEVLVGERPFGGDSAPQILAAVRRAAPPPPRERCPESPEDLVAIVERALQHDPAQRYADATELAADLQRFLGGQRVQARAYRTVDLVARVLRAWRLPLLAGAVGLAVVVVVALISSLRTVEERDRAVAAEQDLRAALLHADGALSRAFTLQARDAAAKTSRAEAELLASRALELAPQPEAWGVLAALSGTPRPRLVSQTHFAEPCERPVVGPSSEGLLCAGATELTWVSLATGQVVWRLPVRADRVAVLHGGARAWAIVDRDTALLLDVANGEVLDRQEIVASYERVAAGATPGTVAITDNRRLLLVDVDAAEPASRELSVCGGSAHSQVVPGVGGQVLVLCDDGSWTEVDAAGTALRRVRAGTEDTPRDPTHGALSPDGRTLVVLNRRGWLVSQDHRSGAVLHRVPLDVGPLLHAAWSPDSDRVVVQSQAGPAVIWDARTGVVRERLPGSGARSSRFVDANTILQVGTQGTVRWTLPSGGVPHRISRGSGVTDLELSADGQHLVSCRGGGTLTVHELPSGAPLAEVGHPDLVCKDAAIVPDGSLALAGYARVNDLLTVDLRTGATGRFVQGAGRKNRRIFTLLPDVVVSLDYNPGGPVAHHMDGSADGRLTVPNALMWDAEASVDHRFGVAIDEAAMVYRFVGGARPGVETLWRDDEAACVAISADGERILVGRKTEAVARDRQTGAVVARYGLGFHRATEVALSWDDALVAVGDLGGGIWIFDRGQTMPRAVLRGHDQRVAALAFSADGRTLFSGSWDGEIRAWDVAVLGEEPAALRQAAEADWGQSVEAMLSGAGSSPRFTGG